MTVRCGTWAQSGTVIRLQLSVVGLVMWTCEISASAVIPLNIETAMAPMATRVFCAFFAFGGLNAGTPFAIASTPVRAVHPDENARRAKNIRANRLSEP